MEAETLSKHLSLGKDSLSSVFYKPTPTAVLALVGLAPLYIAYLAHVPDTQAYRLGSWFVGVTCWMWCMVTIDIDPITNLRVIYMGIFGVGSYYAWTGSVVEYHPLPRETPLAFLRSYRSVQAVLLIIDAHRLITVKGFMAPVERFSGTTRQVYLHAIRRHFCLFIFGVVVFDLASYPPYRLAPDTFGSLDFVGGDVHRWYDQLATECGVPVLLVRAFFSTTMLLMGHFGWVMQYHLVALLGIISGVWAPEEWPDFSDWPVLACSLNDFWARRWHQFNRQLYLIVARPFRHNRVVHTLAVFPFSALLHIAMYYPRRHELIVFPYLRFYFASAIGCLAERQYKRFTGRRVEGIWGWVWTWTVLLVLGQETLDVELGSGWIGRMRHTFAQEPRISIACWVVHALKFAPSPIELADAATAT